MDKKILTWIIGIVVIVGIGVGVYFWVQQQNAPGKYDAFAKCIASKGVTFYGAFWCPHCQDQKAMFGSSAKYLPYVECSTPDSNGQTPVCQQASIQGYPTWQFADKTRQEGEMSLQDLAKKTGCALPQ